MLGLIICTLGAGAGRDGLPAFIWRALTEGRYFRGRWGIEWGDPDSEQKTVRSWKVQWVGRLWQALMEDRCSINGCDAKWLAMVESSKVTFSNRVWRGVCPDSKHKDTSFTIYVNSGINSSTFVCRLEAFSQSTLFLRNSFQTSQPCEALLRGNSQSEQGLYCRWEASSKVSPSEGGRSAGWRSAVNHYSRPATGLVWYRMIVVWPTHHPACTELYTSGFMSHVFFFFFCYSIN